MTHQLPDNQVTVFVTTYCTYCVAAKAYLDRLGVGYKTVDCTTDHATRNWLVEASGMKTVPQIFVGQRSIGGFTDMRSLDQRGGFKPLLQAAGIAFKA